MYDNADDDDNDDGDDNDVGDDDDDGANADDGDDDDAEDDNVADDDVEDEFEDDDVEKEEDDDVEVEKVVEDGEKDHNVAEDEAEDDVADDEVEDDDVEDDGVKGEEDNDVENDDVEQEEDDNGADDEVEGGEPITRPRPQFVLACAVERHLDLQGKCRAPEVSRTFCASLRSAVEMHLDMSQEHTRAILCRNLRRKRCAPGPRHRHRASLRSRHALGQATLCRSRGEHRAPGPRHRLGRACAVEMHLDMSQEPPYAEIYKENAARHRLCASLRNRNALGQNTRAILCENLQERSRKPQSEHLDQAPALTLTVRTPQRGHAASSCAHTEGFLR